MPLRLFVPILALHGMWGSARTLILVDGQPQNDAYSAATPWNAMATDNVERIEVIRGAGSSLYGGNAMGGVVNIITKSPKNREIMVKAGAGTDDTYSYGFQVGERYEDLFGLRLGFQGGETGGYPAQLVTKTVTGTGTGVGAARNSGGYDTLTNAGAPVVVVGDRGDNWAKNWATNLAGSANSTELGRADLGFAYSRYEYGYGSPHSYVGNFSGRVKTLGGRYATLSQSDFISGAGRGQDDVASWTGQYKKEAAGFDLTAKAMYQMKDKWYTSPNTSPSTNNWDRAAGTLSDASSDYWNLDLLADRRLFGDHLLTFGGTFRTDSYSRHEYNLSDYHAENSRLANTVEVTGASESWAGFAQYELPVVQGLTVYAGVRLDYWKAFDGMWRNSSLRNSFSKPENNDWSLKLAAVWNPLEDTYVRGAASKAFRALTLYDLYGQWTWGTTIYYSNPDLKPETLWTYELSGDQYFFDRKLRLSAAVFHTDLENSIQTTTVGTGNYKYNMEEATVDGYELEAQFTPWDWLRLWANYSYNYAVATRNDRDPRVKGQRLTNVPEDLANLGAEFSWEWVRLNVAGNYVGRMYSSDLNTDVIADVPGGFSRVWVFDTKLTLTPVEHFALSFSVDNVLDEKYYSTSYAGKPRSVFAELKYTY